MDYENEKNWIFLKYDDFTSDLHRNWLFMCSARMLYLLRPPAEKSLSRKTRQIEHIIMLEYLPETMTI